MRSTSSSGIGCSQQFSQTRPCAHAVHALSLSLSPSEFPLHVEMLILKQVNQYQQIHTVIQPYSHTVIQYINCAAARVQGEIEGTQHRLQHQGGALAMSHEPLDAMVLLAIPIRHSPKKLITGKATGYQPFLPDLDCIM